MLPFCPSVEDSFARIFLLALGVVIGSGTTYYFGLNAIQRKQIMWQKKAQAALGRVGNQAGINLDALQNKYNDLRAKLLIDEAPIEQFGRDVTRLQEDLELANEQLSFYEELAPSGAHEALSIRVFEASIEGSRLRYKVVLTRNGTKLKPFKGRLQFMATGTINGRTESLVLYPEVLSDDPTVATGTIKGKVPVKQVTTDSRSGVNKKTMNNSELRPISSLQFDRIQRSQGFLVVPDGFVPDEITVNVLEGDNLRVSRSRHF